MDIILGLIWVGTPHIQIGLDTAYYSESGKDTAHNITCYSESGGDTAQENVFRYSHWGGDTAHNTTYYLESGGGDTTQENVFRCSHWGGDTAQNSKKEGGGHRTKFKVGCWLGGWSNDYSANPGSILQAETCKILS